MVDMTAKVGRLRLANPVIAASGTFGYGREFSQFYDLSVLGAVVCKTVTLNARQGSPPPRTVETPAGMLNNIGLANPGIDKFLAEELPFMRGLGTRVVVNIAGDTPEEFAELAGQLGRAGGVDALEINVSCPNVERGGMLFGQVPSATADVVRTARDASNLPLWVKLTPNVTDIREVAVAASEAGAEAVVVANTLLGMAVDWRKRRPLLGGTTGGLSGPAIKPVALRMVWQVHEAVDVSVIGSGGVTTAEDALEFIAAGACAVEVGTANFTSPTACRRIVTGMRGLLDEADVGTVSSLIGALGQAQDGPGRHKAS